MSLSSRTRSTLLAALATPVIFGIIVPLQGRIEAKTHTIQQQKEELMFRSPALLQKLSLGYGSLLADIYWTRAVQYYGTKVQSTDPQFELLGPLLDLATGLDPHLVVAYKFGAILLSEPRPVGAGRPDLAVDLVKRGISANPDDWWLDADLGFVYYWHLRDFQRASDAYLAGSKVPGAPVWLRAMAARIAEQGGSDQLSLALWSEVYESSQDSRVRANALKHLAALKAHGNIEQLQNLVAQYRQRFGEYPSSFNEMVAAGVLRSIPVDPSGAPYILDDEGQVQLSPSSSIDLKILQGPQNNSKPTPSR